MTVRRSARTGASALLWIAASLLALRLGVLTARAVITPAHGFVTYYTAARLLVEGQEVSRFYDDDWFRGEVARHEPAVSDIYGANPPTTAMLFAPWAAVEYGTARRLWTAASYLALLGTVLWLAWRCRLGSLWAPAFVGMALAGQPSYENLLHGQMYIALLAGITVAWAGYRRGAAAQLGAVTGALLAVKTAGLTLWPMLVAQRRIRSVLWGAGVVMALMLASLPAVGVGAWRAYVHRVARLPNDASLSVTAYQTQHSLVQHVLARDPRWNPAPLFDLPAAATVVSWIAALALVAVSVIVAAKRRDDDLVFAAFVALALILSPVSLDYHYTLALLPLAILLGHVVHRPWSVQTMLVAAGAVLIAADLPYRSPRLAAGALSLLAYPKLYGAYLLWGVAFWGAHRRWSPPTPT